jgi:hypothetical protein
MDSLKCDRRSDSGDELAHRVPVTAANRFGFVSCAQAGLRAGNGVLAEKNARSAEQDESRFHN